MSDNIENLIKPIRKGSYFNEILIIDGQPGSGKSVISGIVSTLDRVEILKVIPEIENILALRHIKNISKDGAETFIKLQLDLILYELMMSRNLNFRFNDQTSAFSDNFLKYFLRLFQKGDSEVIKKIFNEKPILHLMTHSMLSICEPLLNVTNNKLKIIEVVKHPKTMILVGSRYNNDWMSRQGRLRQFQIFTKANDIEVPFWANQWSEKYLKSNSVERTIYEIEYQSLNTQIFKEKNKFADILTIPFEKLIVKPQEYVNKIEAFVGTSVRKKSNLKKIFNKFKLPRKNSELDNLEIKKIDNFIFSNKANKESISVLEKISNEYEKTFLS